MDSQITTGQPLWQRLKAHFSDSFSGDFIYQRRAFDARRMDELLAQRRRDAYRYILILLACITVPINTHNLYSDQTVPAVAGLLLLAILVANIWLLSTKREALLTPAVVLLLSISLVLLSVFYGQNYSLYWLYPLLVALPILLKPRLAAWLGLLCGAIVVPFLFAKYDTRTATVLSLSMALTWLASAWLVYAVTEQASRLRDMAVTDALTGAYNRRYLELQLQQALGNWQRYGKPSTLLLIDIDHFKRINDRFGHGAGDDAIRGLVDVISRRIRSVDTLCRYGGEEFVVLLSETGMDDAARVAEKLRAAVEAADVLPEGSMTISAGVSGVSIADDVDHWLNLADGALYLAKHNGRNRVELAESAVEPMAPLAKTIPDWR
jgi:diguanylate cyclase (GGDEF)-like protein